MKKLVGLISFLSLSLSAISSNKIELNGEWTFNFENEKSIKVIVPHTWNAEDGCAGPKSKKHNAMSVQSNSYKRGKGFYNRLISLKPLKNMRYFIRGEGASIVSEVTVNGKNVGKHEGAFTAFCYEITDVLQNGENNISVMVNNVYHDHILPLSGDFSMFGGLYRSIEIIEKPQTCIVPDFFATPGIWLSAKPSEKQKDEEILTVTALISERGVKAAEVKVELFDKNGKKVQISENSSDRKFVQANEIFPIKQVATILPSHVDIKRYLSDSQSKTFVQSYFVKNPELWQGRENPVLYKVVISVLAEDGKVLDKIEQPFGFRHYEMNPKQGFVLNGKAMTLRGVNRHQDREGKGWAILKKDETQDIAMILEMGADALRTAHYPSTKHIYDLCDQAGLVVWSEVSAIERVRNRADFIDNMNTQATEMVLQHYNHPSICVWGLYNEIYHQTSAEDRKHDMIKVLKGLNQVIKTLDPQRPTVGNTNQLGNKTLSNIGDIFSANVYPGWYGGGPERMGESIDGGQRSLPQKAFGLGEYGHGADIEDHEYPVKQPRPVSPWHPEEWQAFAHEVNYKHIKVRPFLWGTFIWNMFDFATVERIEGAKAGMNDKGLVTYDRQVKKDAFYFYKANWNPELMAHIVSKRFVQRPNKPKNIEVKVYSNAESVTLYLNGKIWGESQKPSDLKVVSWKNVPLEIGENQIKVEGVLQGKTVQDSCIFIRQEQKKDF